MNPHYSAYIELGKTLVQEKGLQWGIDLDEAGAARDGIGWNLTSIARDVPPPTHYLRDLGPDVKALAIVNAERETRIDAADTTAIDRHMAGPGEGCGRRAVVV
jgi:hypothetical protein